ncbi:hypothetical protein Agabi119p4_7319 [Agaricus bisporus var. burnettii]|uniref:Uncharacterized protein n=1 Tax=Agaricus bisporus var. burnettii TaxID=192524 RepID=A0A8H7C7V3_AGABI|nr:hypothetical protein Agabi119p4_7319 [Agaricus bisporus var. burnettii]
MYGAVGASVEVQPTFPISHPHLIYTLFFCWNLGGLLFCCLQYSLCHCPFMVPVVVDIVLGHLPHHGLRPPHTV